MTSELHASTCPRAFHVMVKPTGAICNLDCSYCFFLSKQMLYPGSRFRMGDALLESYIRQLLEAHQVSPVNIAWQGGEPTLIGIDFFERAIGYVEKYRRPGQWVEYSFQTNGVLLDDAWGAFLSRHRFLVGISIDGPRPLHDAYRVDKKGEPTFDRVMKGLAILRKYGVRWNVLTTLHRANADYPIDVYRFLKDECGATFIQFIPIVERKPGADSGGGTVRTGKGHDRGFYHQSGDAVTERSITPEAYGRFLIKVFDRWVRRDVGRVYIQMFDAALASWCGAQPSLCVFAETCGAGVALEHNGDLYSCDHYVEPDYRLGNILDTPMAELVGSERQRRFGLAKRETLPACCRECEYRFACHGGCPKDRFLYTADGEPGLNYLCGGYHAFFKHIDPAMKTMASLLRAGRAPAAIMKMPA